MNKIFEAIAQWILNMSLVVCAVSLVAILATLSDINHKLDRQYQVTVTSTTPLVNITKE